MTGGAFGSTEFVATVGYAQQTAGVAWGIAAKTVEHRLGGSKDLVLAADISVSIELGEFRVGLAAQNLGSDLRLGGASVDLARRVIAYEGRIEGTTWSGTWVYGDLGEGTFRGSVRG